MLINAQKERYLWSRDDNDTVDVVDDAVSWSSWCSFDFRLLDGKLRSAIVYVSYNSCMW